MKVLQLSSPSLNLNIYIMTVLMINNHDYKQLQNVLMH